MKIRIYDPEEEGVNYPLETGLLIECDSENSAYELGVLSEALKRFFNVFPVQKDSCLKGLYIGPK